MKTFQTLEYKGRHIHITADGNAETVTVDGATFDSIGEARAHIRRAAGGPAYEYTAADIGCYADGAGGHMHVRERLAEMVAVLGHSALASELHGDMTDDASEETDALEVLQEVTKAGATWEFRDGDLILSLEENEND
jgi:hypothetical protein